MAAARRVSAIAERLRSDRDCSLVDESPGSGAWLDDHAGRFIGRGNGALDDLDTGLVELARVDEFPVARNRVGTCDWNQIHVLSDLSSVADRDDRV